MRRFKQARRGASIVEFALVAPLAILILVGLIVSGLGIFRYIEIAALAREASRWASVRGGDFQTETNRGALTAKEVYDNVIAPRGVALDMSQLTYTVTWPNGQSPYRTRVVNGSVVPVRNTVKVTIRYQWAPEAYLGVGMLSSTSESVIEH